MVKFLKASVAALIAVAVVAAAGVAIGQEDDAPPTDESAQEEAAPGQDEAGGDKSDKKRRRHLGRGLRGDITVMTDDGTTKVVHFENGEVSGVTDSGFTITGADGVSVAVVVNDETKIVPDGTELGDLDGKKVRVVAETQDGDAWVATVIFAKKPGHRPQRDGAGDKPGTPGEESDSVEGTDFSL